MNIYDATEQAYKNGYAQGREDARKCVFCGKPTKGDCVCSKCERTKMYEHPSLLKKIWCAIKSMFKK